MGGIGNRASNPTVKVPRNRRVILMVRSHAYQSLNKHCCFLPEVWIEAFQKKTGTKDQKSKQVVTVGLCMGSIREKTC